MVRPSRRREMAMEAVKGKDISITLACEIFAVSQTCYRYEAKGNVENARIADWLVRLTDNQRNWGFGLCFCICATSKGIHGITTGCTGSTGNWSST